VTDTLLFVSALDTERRSDQPERKKKMKFRTAAAIAVAAISFSALAMPKQDGMDHNPMVGGAAMMKSMDIVDNAVNSPDHTTLVAAVKAAGLVDALKGKGPFTVFAPTNGAFKLLPDGTVDTLLKPENKDTLTKVLTYHVVPGVLDSKALKAGIRKGNGSFMVKALSGDMLTFMMNGPMNIVVKDAKGGVASISTYDVYQSNGVIQVIDKVLMP
jgi:uncharacterized surface protein with fasciclin (FAS1) repeats